MDENRLRGVGIDYDAALARFVGKRAIYEKYLIRFLEDEHAMEAAKAFEERNYEEMLEQTHALKGLAGTLGMTSLFEVSSDIVKDLRSGEVDELEEKLKKLLAERERIARAIRTA